MAATALKGEKKPGATLLSTTAGGASLLIALQAGSRALTFIVNQILLRYLSPELLAISTQLEVYCISILFFARESLRVAIQRQTDSNDAEPGKDAGRGHVDSRTAAGKSQAIVNLSYISILLGLGFTVFMEWSYLHAGKSDVVDAPYFQESLRLYGIAAILELLAEPCFVVVQQKSTFKIRAAAESVATVSRCITTCGLAVWAAQNQRYIGVLPFAVGQGTYAVSILLVYYWGVWNIAFANGFSLMIKPIYRYLTSRKGCRPGCIWLIQKQWKRNILFLKTHPATWSKPSLVKHFLTQGDTILIVAMASQTAQGIYALASNYGGLVARLVLQPVEEMSRNYFGKLLSVPDGDPPKNTIEKAIADLQRLLQAYLLLSVIVMAIGPTAAPLLINMLAGPRWQASGAGHVLAWYCYYIPLLALNGISEAFVSSVATKTEVYKQSIWMTAFSMGFGCAAYLFLGVMDLGAEGLVLANMVNMLLRIVWSGIFIKKYCIRHGTKFELRNHLSRPSTISLAVVTYATLAQMEKNFSGRIMDLVKTGSVALTFVILLAITERKYLVQCYRTLKG
ncbi:oligosaccharide translocation rft1 protein [Rutstroemia sp. NJR-2017a WRK4]|nr:oligosaccharide translocation rft1 protein [Rutstroemia sp. NJR-2017a WRK4]